MHRRLLALLIAGSALPLALSAQTRAATTTDGPVPHPTPLAGAQWITGAWLAAAADTVHWTPEHGAANVTGPFPLLRKTFLVSRTSPVAHATLVITALGTYRATLNGRPVSDNVLSPEWTDYRERVQYQTYDVTRLVQTGTNALGVMLGEGWFGSPLEPDDTPNPYAYAAPPVRLLCALHVTYANGQHDTIVSDRSWRSTSGPILQSQIYDGETYDARRLPPRWDRGTFNDRTWDSVRVYAALPHTTVVPQFAPFIRRTRTMTPVQRIVVSHDTTVYDLGQNIAGWATLRVTGPAGARVTLRFSELLEPDGKHLNRASLALAKATDTYVLAGGASETFEPHFTYHGFRYMEVVTTPGVRAGTPVAYVLRSDVSETATFESNNPKLNRLWQNIVWSLRDNLMGVPTDCPQRNERLGWMGDAGVFWPTATYLMQLGTFTRKWLQDIRDTQTQTEAALHVGCFPDFTPSPLMAPQVPRCGGPGWSDAGIFVPYAAFRQYGDTTLVREHWAAMEQYMAFIADSNSEGPTAYRWAHRNRGWGDWLPAGDTTPRDTHTSPELLATSLWAADARAMHDMALGLKDTAAAERYGTLYDKIRAAYQAAYLRADGVVGQEVTLAATGQTKFLTSQTSYAMALRFGLLPDSVRARAVQHLADDIAAHHGHLATGFLGTPQLLPALSEYGRDDVAYQLLVTESYPSWFYMVDNGATTMWERWDGDKEQQSEMNSYNHYSYGSVGEWLLRYAVGITQTDDSAGFRSIVIRPHPDPLGRITHLGASYRSVVGTITSRWTVDSTTHVVTLDVTIPAHRTARVDVPVYDGTAYRYVSHQVTGGTHHFQGRS